MGGVACCSEFLTHPALDGERVRVRGRFSRCGKRLPLRPSPRENGERKI